MAEPALKIETDADWSVSDRRERDLLQNSEAMSDPVGDPGFPTSRGKLTKAEIEALLRPDLPDDFGKEEPVQTEVRGYTDFSLPERPQPKPGKEDGQTIAAALSLGLRQDCELPAAARVVSMTSGDFGEVFVRAGQGSACLFFRGPSGAISAAMTLSPELTSSFIDLACGGEGTPSGVAGRALTFMDGELLESLLSPLASSLGEGFSLARTEIDARFASAMAPPGTSEIIDLSITLGGLETPARLVMLKSEDEAEAPSSIEDIDGDFATAVLTARIASLSVPVSRLSDLKPGATLMLGIPADQPVELLSGGREGMVAAEGEIGRKGNAIAIRITRRGRYLRKAARSKANREI